MYFLGAWWLAAKSVKDLNTNSYTHQKYGMESSTLRGCVWDRSEFYENSWELSSRYLKIFSNTPKSGVEVGNRESRIVLLANISN